MPYLISYDIADDALRTKVAQRLLAIGCVRLQKSVFAGTVKDALHKELLRWLAKKVTAPDDSVFVLDVGPDTLQQARWIGKTAPDWQMATGPPEVLFI